MPKRFYTLIVVPNASSRLHKVRVPVQVMYVLAAIGFISFFVAIGLGFNYARMAFRTADYNTLQAENKELQIEKKNLEVSTKKLSSKISNLETLSEKLTSLIENDTFMKKVGRGGVGGSTVDYPTTEILNRTAGDIDSLKDRATELENQMQALQELAEKRARTIRYTPTIWPIHGPVGSHFGGRVDPFTGESEIHLGLDISGLWGTPVHAPADGLVIYASRMSDYGNLIILDHGDGLTTRLGHLSRFQVKVGQTIHKNDIVGYVGMTGRTTGPHLHYEVRLNDRPVNPRKYLPDAN